MRTESENGDLGGDTEDSRCGAFARLVDQLERGRAALLVRASEIVSDAWLTPERILQPRNVEPLCPNDIELTQLDDRIWALTTRVPFHAHEPDCALHIRVLQIALTNGLTRQWRESIEGDADETAAPFTVTPISEVPNLSDRDQNLSDLNSLLDTIVNRKLTVQFQPLVSLRDGTVFGYEALIRGPKGAALRRPGQMFRAADKARMVAWFDLACLRACFERAAEQKLRRLLFVNLDAEGLAYLDLEEGSLERKALELGLDPSAIVIEVTERQTVEQYPGLREGIERLREQGFRIAVDDAGAGYSSLNVIADLRPDYIKIDHSLVRGIDVNGAKRAILNAFAQFARSTGTAILAEGIETRDELSALIDLGVTYGQGFLLGRPNDEFRGVRRETREFMRDRSARSSDRHCGGPTGIGSIARSGLTAPPEALLADVARRFAKDGGLASVVVVENGQPRGLATRSDIEAASRRTSGAAGALIGAVPIDRWTRRDVIVVCEEESIDEVARQSSARRDVSLETDIIVVRWDGSYLGVVSARELMEAVRASSANRDLRTDPLTGLANRLVLEQTVRKRIERREPIALIRVDIVDLDGYNRQHGIEAGDKLIQSVADLLREASAEVGTTDDLIVSLGGDNLVLLTGSERATDLRERISEASTVIGGINGRLAVGVYNSRSRKIAQVRDLPRALEEIVRLSPTAIGW